MRGTSVSGAQASFLTLGSPSNYTPSVWHLFTTLLLERIITADLLFLLFTFSLIHSYEGQVNERRTEFQLIKNEESVNLYEANTIATVNMGISTYEPQTSKLAVAVALQLLTAPRS